MKAKKKKYHVFFVDDDPGIRRLISEELEALNCNVSSFANASQCLEKLPQQNCNLLITDVKMPGMDGMTLLNSVKRIAPWVPVMLITGFGDIPMSVRSIKMGAEDFIEKPLDRKAFLYKVKTILNRNNFEKICPGQALTKAEKKILKLILDGKANKQIAHILGRALRTVERHRSSIMHKFDVDNIVDLIKKASNLNPEDAE